MNRLRINNFFIKIFRKFYLSLDSVEEPEWQHRFSVFQLSNAKVFVEKWELK